jgi:ubiquinol-cytochrome c reductase cytochrome c subunit
VSGPPAFRRLSALILLGLGPTMLIQLLLGSPRPAQGQVDEQTARGFDLYVAGCSSCHGVMGEGTGQGPPLAGVGPAAVDFMLSTGRMPLADPDEQPVRNPPRYKPAEIAAIVAYVASLSPGGPEIPMVVPESGDLARGREIYVANCLACHGAAAQGASVGGGAVAPSLLVASPVQLAESARIGPGVMPLFDEDVISDEDMNSLARYVLSLRAGQDAGGLGLGHVGPVIEGLVGWLVGLGLLVVVIRLTGTRT